MPVPCGIPAAGRGVVADGGATAGRHPRRMDRKDIAARWQAALDAARAAVDAASAARTLTPDDCGIELARIRVEREWLDRVRRQ